MITGYAHHNQIHTTTFFDVDEIKQKSENKDLTFNGGTHLVGIHPFPQIG